MRRSTATTRTRGSTSARCCTTTEHTELTLLKCCLRERGIEREDARMIVPWGANLEEVRQALKELVA